MILPPLAAVLAGIGAVGVVMLGLWAWSVRLRDVSMIDAFWAPGFVVATVAAWAAAGAAGARPLLVIALVATWGLRLGFHLARRWWTHPKGPDGTREDFRYAAMRKRFGPSFVYSSLGIVFGLQAVLMWTIVLPLQAAVTLPAPLGVLDGLGAVLAIAGLVTEGVADAQLARFKADPSSRGRVMDQGLWRYSRHPNYFGDALMWWGFGAFAVAVGAPVLLFGPALMTFLLLRVSGVALLERDIVDRRPKYADYIRRTSSFIPWFPRRD